MPYAEGRTFFDADSHIMELPEFLRSAADPAMRDRILAVTIDDIGRVGPTAFNAKYVCEVLDIAPSLINHHFGGRDEPIPVRALEGRRAALHELGDRPLVPEPLGLDDRSVQRILRDIDNKTLALALKGASAELKTRIIGQMSQRASRALADEMEMLGPVRMRDVEAAQMGIVAQIRTLEEAGEIVLGASADDLVA